MPKNINKNNKFRNRDNKYPHSIGVVLTIVSILIASGIIGPCNLINNDNIYYSYGGIVFCFVIFVLAFIELCFPGSNTKWFLSAKYRIQNLSLRNKLGVFLILVFAVGAVVWAHTHGYLWARALKSTPRPSYLKPSASGTTVKQGLVQQQLSSSKNHVRNKSTKAKLVPSRKPVEPDVNDTNRLDLNICIHPVIIKTEFIDFRMSIENKTNDSIILDLKFKPPVLRDEQFVEFAQAKLDDWVWIVHWENGIQNGIGELIPPHQIINIRTLRFKYSTYKIENIFLVMNFVHYDNKNKQMRYLIPLEIQIYGQEKIFAQPFCFNTLNQPTGK